MSNGKKMHDAVGLLGFDDDVEAQESDASADPGELEAAEELGDAFKTGKPDKILTSMKALLDLLS